MVDEEEAGKKAGLFIYGKVILVKREESFLAPEYLGILQVVPEIKLVSANQISSLSRTPNPVVGFQGHVNLVSLREGNTKHLAEVKVSPDIIIGDIVRLPGSSKKQTITAPLNYLQYDHFRKMLASFEGPDLPGIHFNGGMQLEVCSEFHLRLYNKSSLQELSVPLSREQYDHLWEMLGSPTSSRGLALDPRIYFNGGLEINITGGCIN